MTDCETCAYALYDIDCFSAHEHFVAGCQLDREPADDCSDYREE